MPSLISSVTQGIIEGALSQLTQISSGGGAGHAEEPRAAFVFTSRFRQGLLAAAPDRILSLERSIAIGNGLKNTSKKAAKALANTKVRLIDFLGQLDRAMPSITMLINPNTVEFDQPKRWVKQDTMRGSVIHHFTNNKGQNLDLLTIKMTGNTGNISRQGKTADERDRAIQRLIVWQNLYQLTREPEILTDGTANLRTISYVSPLFPIQIDFKGFFTKTLSFSESAKKPNSRDYSMEFMVQATTPDLDTLVNSILDYVNQSASASPSKTATKTVAQFNPLAGGTPFTNINL